MFVIEITFKQFPRFLDAGKNWLHLHGETCFLLCHKDIKCINGGKKWKVAQRIDKG